MPRRLEAMSVDEQIRLLFELVESQAYEIQVLNEFTLKNINYHERKIYEEDHR